MKKLFAVCAAYLCFALALALALAPATARPDEINHQLRFTIETPMGPYSDALNFSDDEWAKRDQKAIDAAKQQRVDNWLATLAAAPKVETKEDKRARADALDAQIADLAAQKSQLLNEIGAAP